MLIFTSFQHLSTMLADLLKSSDKCGTNVVANIENVLTGLMYTLTATTTPSQLTMKFMQLFVSTLSTFVFLPLIQKEIDIFRDTIWNSHRVRCQKDAQLPKGVPSHLYSFPENYSSEQCGMADN